MNEHSPIICFILGLAWSLSGAMTILSYVIWDQNRLSEEPHYKRFKACVWLFGLASVFFLTHEFIS